MGSFQTDTGSIHLTSGRDINITGDTTTLFSNTGAIRTLSARNTNITRNVFTSGPILIISGVDTHLDNADITSTSSSVTLVVDNASPFDTRPNIGPGIYIMGSSINSGPSQPLKIFTALQQVGGSNNQIATNSLFNGVDPYASPYFYPTAPIFKDTLYEVWCVYFSDNSQPPYPGVGLGFPFTIFYKNCQAQIIPPANQVVSEMLFAEAPASDYLDWPDFIAPWRFKILYDSKMRMRSSFEELYWIQRKKIRFIHLPETDRVPQNSK